MNSIVDGVRRFQDNVYPSMSEHFQGLAKGQSPPTFFIACSDSRVDPSLITQTQPGEIFVLRNAGNFALPYGVDGGVDSAVEYAVAVLGVQRIVVCGHSGCGAVGGALAPDTLSAVPAVQRWVRHGAPAAHATAHLGGEARYTAAIEVNVAQQLANLRTHPSVQEAGESLELVGWVYDIATGTVKAVNEQGAA
jgi:carbonic anhydrase